MTYGLFIRLFSLNGLSLWPVIFMQCFLLVWLIYQLIGAVLEENHKFRGFVFLAVIVVASFSGAGWASCYLIPDIFTPIMLLLGASGAPIAGYIFDQSGSYDVVWWASAALMFVSGILIRFAKPPTLPSARLT